CTQDTKYPPASSCPPPCPSAAPSDEQCSPPCAEPAEPGTTGQEPFAPCPSGSGVVGFVHAGPTCPVEQYENPCPPDYPVETTLRLLRPDGSVAAKGVTNPDGTFGIAVEPGKYQLVADNNGGFMPGGCPAVDVVVEPDRWARADMACDTGIR
ncbi:MAG: hypothetical protein ACRDZ7_10205, partial [Acidimicrobiia bacterium]